MESIAPNARHIVVMRKREPCCHDRYFTVKRRVETGDLRQLGAGRSDCSNWCQVVKLMQRREGCKTLKSCEQVSRNDFRLSVIRSAVHHAMSDRAQPVVAKMIVDPPKNIFQERMKLPTSVVTDVA